MSGAEPNGCGEVGCTEERPHEHSLDAAVQRAGGEQNGDTVTERPIPHDPPKDESGEYGTDCPICNVTWPCAERTRQRREKKAIQNYLRSALYGVIPGHERPRIDGVPAVRWESPLQWYADMTYGEHGIVMVVHSYDGDHRNDDADVTWLDRVLP